MLDQDQDPTFVLKMRDEEFWKFSVSNRAMQAMEESLQRGESTSLHMVFAMSLDYRISTGKKVTFDQFRDKLLPSMRTSAYKRFRDSLMAAMSDEGNETLEPALVEPAENA